jgi:hypothetical protein
MHSCDHMHHSRYVHTHMVEQTTVEWRHAEVYTGDRCPKSKRLSGRTGTLPLEGVLAKSSTDRTRCNVSMGSVPSQSGKERSEMM